MSKDEEILATLNRVVCCLEQSYENKITFEEACKLMGEYIAQIMLSTHTKTKTP